MSVISQAHVDPDNDHWPVSLEYALDRIAGSQPAWLLDLNGYLIEANPLALWIWGGVADTGAPEFDQFSAKTVFEIFAENFDRVPVDLNQFFWYVKLWIDHQINEGQPSPFDRLRRISPEIQRLSEMARGKRPSRIYHYDLRLKSPVLDSHSPSVLEFQTEIRTVTQDGQDVGFLAVYVPNESRTARAVDKKLQVLAEAGLADIVSFRGKATRPRMQEAAAGRAGDRPRAEAFPGAMQSRVATAEVRGGRRRHLRELVIGMVAAHDWTGLLLEHTSVALLDELDADSIEYT